MFINEQYRSELQMRFVAAWLDGECDDETTLDVFMGL